MRSIVFAIIASALSLPAYAQTYPSQKFKIPVLTISPTSFEVLENDGAGPAQMWCAAGVYVERVLGQRGGQLWVAEPLRKSPRDPQRKGLVFSTTPIAPEQTSITFALKSKGLQKSVASARAACNFFDTRVEVRVDNERRIRARR